MVETPRKRNPEEYREVKPRGSTTAEWRKMQRKSGFKNQYERIAKTPGQSHKNSPFKTHPLHGGLAGLATGVAHHVLGIGGGQGPKTSDSGRKIISKAGGRTRGVKGLNRLLKNRNPKNKKKQEEEKEQVNKQNIEPYIKKKDQQKELQQVYHLIKLTRRN